MIATYRQIISATVDITSVNNTLVITSTNEKMTMAIPSAMSLQGQSLLKY